MPIWQISIIVIGSIGSLGLLAFGAGYLMSQFGKGSRDDKTSIMESAEKLTTFWKDQAEGYKVMMAEKDNKNQGLINDLTRQVGELRGQLNEKQASYDKLEKVLQGRGPEQEKFMATMLSVAEQAQSFMTTQQKFSESMGKLMEQIDTHLKSQDLKVVSTITKQ